MTTAPSRLTIAIGPTPADALSLALASWRGSRPDPPLTLATDLRDRSLLATIREALGLTAPGSVAIIRRPTGANRVAALLASPADWATVDRTASGGQFGAVRVPGALGVASSFVGVTLAPEPRRTARPPIMAFWAGFADPRQAAVAFLAGPMSGLIAELAFAFSPRLNILLGTRGTQALAIVSDDILSADLGWLALGPREPDQESVGPWEHPVVQHAAAMGFGVAGPDRLELRVQAPPEYAADRQRIESAVRLALGLPLEVVHRGQ